MWSNWATGAEAHEEKNVAYMFIRLRTVTCPGTQKCPEGKVSCQMPMPVMHTQIVHGEL